MATRNFKIVFRDMGNPNEGVFIVENNVVVPEIVISADTTCVFDADDLNSDQALAQFTFAVSFMPPVKKSAIEPASATGQRRATFIAHGTLLTPIYSYLVIVDAIAPNGRKGSSITGRKPIIRFGSSKLREAFVAIALTGFLAGMVLAWTAIRMGWF